VIKSNGKKYLTRRAVPNPIDKSLKEVKSIPLAHKNMTTNIPVQALQYKVSKIGRNTKTR